MKKEICKRLVSLVIILFGLSIMTFGLTYILPSNPAEQLAESMGAGHDREVIAKIEEKYGLNKSFGEQYISWLKGALHGDFGMSVKYAQPVSQVLGRKLPNTIKLAVASFILMLLISFPLGILSAVYKDKAADYIIRFMSFLGISLPSFWGGMMLIYLLAVNLHWLPVGGSDSFKSLIMPAITLSLSMSAYYIRRIRAVMVEQMNEEYINGCQARGVGRFQLLAYSSNHAGNVLRRPAWRNHDRGNGFQLEWNWKCGCGCYFRKRLSADPGICYVDGMHLRSGKSFGGHFISVA